MTKLKSALSKALFSFPFFCSYCISFTVLCAQSAQAKEAVDIAARNTNVTVFSEVYVDPPALRSATKLSLNGDESTSISHSSDASSQESAVSSRSENRANYENREPNSAQSASPPQEIKDSLPNITTIDLTERPDDLWERIRNGFGMQNLSSDLVTQQQRLYLAKPEYLRRVVERSRRYMYHIVDELEKRGMPTELALLPIVESAYNPMAYSPAHAAGMWQFIPSTGKNYRLDQNWWMDERRDIVASTSAALSYLQTIYQMHGDWHLALASYNWGEGAVGRAIAKNKAKGLPTDYLSLTMPTETRNYVPKLQALKNIIAQPQLFKVTLNPIPNKPYFVTVEKPAAMDVAIAAKLAEISTEEFLALNPAYNRPVMPIKGNLTFVLPADKAEVFQSNLGAFDKRLTNWQTYQLKKGERLDSVATRYGITAAKLRQVNGISPKTRIGPGTALIVPVTDANANANANAPTDLDDVNLEIVKPTVKKAGKPSKSKPSIKNAKGKKKAAGRPSGKKPLKKTKSKKK